MSKGYRRHDNKYRVDISVRGQRFTRIVDTEDEARQLVQSMRTTLTNGVEQQARRAVKEITLAEAFFNCFNDRDFDDKPWCDSDHGKKQRFYATSMIAFFGRNRLLRTIKLDDWRNYINQFPDTATRNRRASCLTKIFRHALSQNRITINDVLKIRRQRENVASRASTFSVDEESSMLLACDRFAYTDMKDIIICLMDTGCRVEELLSLKPIDLIVTERNDRKLYFLNVTRFKTDTQSLVGVSSRVLEIILKRKNQPRLFMTNYKQVYRKWNTIRHHLGQSDNPNWVMHVCRHTCASRLASRGWPLSAVCGWMGWSPNSPQLKRYLHWFADDVANMANSLNKRNAPDLKVVSGGNSA